LCYSPRVPGLAKPITPDTLELTQLAFFVGAAANSWVLEQLQRAGGGALRQSHGYIVQHLIEAPRAVGELAGLLGISQQAVSKSLAELDRAGVIENVASPDGRVRRVRLSARGVESVQASRALRRKLERRLVRRCGGDAVAAAKRVLQRALEELGGVEAVKQRRVRPPS
jgi:DNA-binding MarR family transcriptional regulator